MENIRHIILSSTKPLCNTAIWDKKFIENSSCYPIISSKLNIGIWFKIGQRMWEVLQEIPF